MKKLMTMLAAVATAFGLYAADSGFISGAGFDTGHKADPANGRYTWLNLNGGTFTEGFWSTSVEDFVTVKAGTYTVPECKVPLQYQGPGNNQYAALKTTLGNPVSMRVKDGEAKQMIGSGLYFDAMVKPTVFDEMPDMTATAYANAKVGVFVYQADDNADKKLFVYAGGSETNFYETTTTIDDAQWYRLTIKMIADIGTDKPGYVVFINGDQVRCNAAKLDPTGLTPAAAEWNATGSLFEGLPNSGTQVSEVLFDGQGDVDEIAFTTTAPDFAADDQFFTLSWTADVKGFTCGDLTTNVTEAGSYIINLGKTIAEDQKVDVTGITYTEDVYGDETAQFAATAKAGTLAKTGAAAASFNGKGYETIQGAVDAANGITVAGTYTLKIKGAAGALTFANANAGVNLILDLAGQTITATTDTPAVNVTAGALTIIDSLTGGTVTGFQSEEGGRTAVKADGGAITISDGIYNGKISPTKKSGTSLTIEGGKFSKADNTDPATSKCKLTAPEGYKFVSGAEAYADYWVLEAIAEVTFTVDVKANTTITEVKVNGATVATADSYDITEGQAYEVTFAADTGYTLSGSETVSGTAGDKAFVVTGPEATAILVTNITVTAAGGVTEVDVGKTLQLTAEVLPADALLKDVTWSSSDDTLATVDATSGLVTGVKAGNVTITATAKDASGVTGTIVLEVKSTAAPVVDPTQPQEVTAEDAEEAKKAVEFKPTAEVLEQIGEDGVDAYMANFDKIATQVGGDGSKTWKVELVLKNEAKQAVAETTETLNDVLALSQADEITLTSAKPGLYYALDQGETLTGRSEGNRVMATKSGVTLQAGKWANSGFYQIKVYATPVK